MTTANAQAPALLGDLDAISQLHADSVVLGPSWWQEKRQSGLAQLRSEGFPSCRVEAWKYTDVAPLLGLRLGLPAASHTLAEKDLETEDARLPHAAIELVFVNGRFDEGLSKGLTLLPANAFVGPVSEAWLRHGERMAATMDGAKSQKETPFAWLNASLMTDGACVYLPKNCIIEQTLHFVFLTSGNDQQTHPRNLFVLEENAQAKLLESWCSVGGGRGRGYVNPVTDVYLGANAKLSHNVWQRLGEETYLTTQTSVSQQRNSSYQHHGIWLGAALCRNDLRVYLQGPGALCQLDGLYITHGTQHIDNHTYIHHEVPHCQSAELYKGILDDDSHGVFNGVVYVHPGASQSDAHQGNHNLLLSPNASIDTKPQLEIFNDDVKCSHGSTVGQLDPNSLFYLRSRGVAQAQAERMLTNAFAGDVIEALNDSELKTRAYEIVNARLALLARGVKEDVAS